MTRHLLAIGIAFLILPALAPVHVRADESLAGNRRGALSTMASEQGHHYHFPAQLAAVLKISPGQVNLPMYVLTMGSNSAHTYVALLDGGTLLGTCTAAGACRYYRFDIYTSLIFAASVVPGGATTAIPTGKAQGDADAQIHYWGKVADQHE